MTFRLDPDRSDKLAEIIEILERGAYPDWPSAAEAILERFREQEARLRKLEHSRDLHALSLRILQKLFKRLKSQL